MSMLVDFAFTAEGVDVLHYFAVTDHRVRIQNGIFFDFFVITGRRYFGDMIKKQCELVQYS